MGHGPSNFKEADVKRAVKAVEAAGKEVESVEIEQGRIKIRVRRKNGGKDDNSNSNPWDFDLK
jgi:hypothetical protein